MSVAPFTSTPRSTDGRHGSPRAIPRQLEPCRSMSNVVRASIFNASFGEESVEPSHEGQFEIFLFESHLD